MTRMIIVFASLAAALAGAGCGSGSNDTSNNNASAVPRSAYSKTPLPKVEPVRGKDYAAQAREGAIARFVQWGNLNYGKTVLVTAADTTCKEQVEDLWNCPVTIDVVKPFKGHRAGPIAGGYTVTRDPEANQLIYISGMS